MRSMDCPKCDADISESYEPDDYSCGIVGGWYCDACDHALAEWQVERDPLPDDVCISIPRDPSKPLGTPLSQISTQPGTSGYAEWLRISRSWGYD